MAWIKWTLYATGAAMIEIDIRFSFLTLNGRLEPLSNELGNTKWDSITLKPRFDPFIKLKLYFKKRNGTAKE